MFCRPNGTHSRKGHGGWRPFTNWTKGESDADSVVPSCGLLCDRPHAQFWGDEISRVWPLWLWGERGGKGGDSSAVE